MIVLVTILGMLTSALYFVRTLPQTINLPDAVRFSCLVVLMYLAYEIGRYDARNELRKRALAWLSRNQQNQQSPLRLERVVSLDRRRTPGSR